MIEPKGSGYVGRKADRNVDGTEELSCVIGSSGSTTQNSGFAAERASR